MSVSSGSDLFWTDDLSVLFNWNRMGDFLPNKTMSSVEKLNAISRFILYGGIVTYLYSMDDNVVVVSLIGLLITYLLHKNMEKFINLDVKTRKQSDFCQKVDSENPFMNVMLNDYIENPHREEACDYHSSKSDIDDVFNKKFPKDFKDIFGKNNSSRQFYTMPSTTIPNNRERFQKWLYQMPETCKERGL